jgi:hypothetical protein
MFLASRFVTVTMHTLRAASGSQPSDPLVASTPESLASDAWSGDVSIPIPGLSVLFTARAEDPRVWRVYTVAVTRSPWTIQGWPEQVWAGQIVPVRLVPDFEGAAFLPLRLRMDLSLATAALEPSEFTLADATTPVELVLHAPRHNAAATLLANTTILLPNPWGFGAGPAASTRVLNGSWTVVGMPAIVYPNQTVSLTLTPSLGDARGITLQSVAALDVAGAPLFPAPVMWPPSYEPPTAHPALPGLPLPAHPLPPALPMPYRVAWNARGFIDPDPVPVWPRQRAQILLSGLKANDSDLTLRPRPTTLRVMVSAHSPRIWVHPIEAPIASALLGEGKGNVVIRVRADGHHGRTCRARVARGRRRAAMVRPDADERGQSRQHQLRAGRRRRGSLLRAPSPSPSSSTPSATRSPRRA